jgi:hypothetical protein
MVSDVARLERESTRSARAVSRQGVSSREARPGGAVMLIGGQGAASANGAVSCRQVVPSGGSVPSTR